MIRSLKVAAVVCGCALAARLGAAEPDANPAAPLELELNLEARVDGRGIFLPQIAKHKSGASLPALKIGDAPVLGQSARLSRGQVQEFLQKADSRLVVSAWSGAEAVAVGRKTRLLEEAELAELLTATLQQEAAGRDRGELELHLARQWTPVTVPDEPLALRVVELPASGISPLFAMRFEILAGKESSGKWHTVVRARLHREVLVAQTPLRRGQAVRVSDFALEKRDALQFRDALSELPSDTSGLDLTENLLPGTPLTARSIQARPVIRRGELVEALFVDGAMTISLKVEALENGAPGQTVRVRNIGSRKEIRGKVRDEQTIVVSM